MIVAAVPVAEVESLWPRVAPMIARSLVRGDGGAWLEDYLENCLSGHWLMVIAIRDGDIFAVAIVSVLEQIRQRTLWVEVAGGADAAVGVGLMKPTLDRMARLAGCQQMAFQSRPGWLRAAQRAGWKHVADIMMISEVGDADK